MLYTVIARHEAISFVIKSSPYDCFVPRNDDVRKVANATMANYFSSVTGAFSIGTA